MARTQKQRVGQWGEAVAAYYLERQGYRILARNVRTARGEIDLVACLEGASPGCIVFVEVKTRTGESFGLPEESVDSRKLEHIFLSAEVFLQDNADLNGMDWRIDVIAIQGRPDAKVEEIYIEHFENVSA